MVGVRLLHKTYFLLEKTNHDNWVKYFGDLFLFFFFFFSYHFTENNVGRSFVGKFISLYFLFLFKFYLTSGDR